MTDDVNSEATPPAKQTPPAEDSSNTENNTNEVDIATIEDGIRKDEARLTVLQEEYNNVADKIHDEFESVLETNPSVLFNEDELEILASDSNIAAKNKMLRDRFESYRDEKLSQKQQEIGKFEDELKGRKGEFDILTQSNKFSKENPDVDMEALAEFIQEDLSPRKKKEFRENSKTKYDFLALAHEEYKKQNPDENNDDDLPPDLSGVNGATGDNSYSDDAEREAYLKSIGIGR
jgi:hypothetical protein